MFENLAKIGRAESNLAKCQISRVLLILIVRATSHDYLFIIRVFLCNIFQAVYRDHLEHGFRCKHIGLIKVQSCQTYFHLIFYQDFPLALLLLVPLALCHSYANTFRPFCYFGKIINCTVVQLMKQLYSSQPIIIQ